jgi:hypothetical protein
MRIIEIGLIGLFLTLLLSSILACSQDPVNIPPGFVLRPSEFDTTDPSGPKNIMPSIPKDWRLIAVNRDDKTEASFLWFQDKAGNILMIKVLSGPINLIVDHRVRGIQAK